MAKEALIQPPTGDTVVEAWSRTVIRNPFRPWVDAKYWAFKSGEDWKAVPDENSQADFRIYPNHHLMFPGSGFKVTSEDGTVKKIRGTITPVGDEPVVVTMIGVRLEAYRAPDERSRPPEPIDIDNW